jgi:hypothetical protein
MISRCTSGVPKEHDVFPRLLYRDSTCSQACRRHSQAFGRCSHVLPGLSSTHLGLSPAHPCAPRCTWRPLHRSSKLWDLPTLGFSSDNSQTLPEAPSDQNTLCWRDLFQKRMCLYSWLKRPYFTNHLQYLVGFNECRLKVTHCLV